MIPCINSNPNSNLCKTAQVCLYMQVHNHDPLELSTSEYTVIFWLIPRVTMLKKKLPTTIVDLLYRKKNQPDMVQNCNPTTRRLSQEGHKFRDSLGNSETVSYKQMEHMLVQH